MSVIFILIACSLLLAASFLGAFLWASRSGQFEDDYTPSIRMLMDDEVTDHNSNQTRRIHKQRAQNKAPDKT